MGIFTSHAQLMARQKQRFAGVRISMKDATRELAHSGKYDFLTQALGTITEKMLRQMGHPFGRTARTLDLTKLNGFRGLQTSETVFLKDGTLKRNKNGGLAFRRGAQITARGRVNPLPINKQTGRLARGIQTVAKRNFTEYDLFSDVPYAKYVLSLTGTSKMIPRGLLGPQGLLRKRYRARHAGIVLGVRMAGRKP